MNIKQQLKPIPPVNAKILSTQKRIIAREYRNRRIGDFLKELHLTEGRGTGVPTIYNAMANNGSPDPVFETDESTYVLVRLPIHPDSLIDDQENDQVNNHADINEINTLEDIIPFCGETSNEDSDQENDQVIQVIKNELNEKAINVLGILENKALAGKEILEALGLSNHTDNKVRYIDPLKNIGWIVYTNPENPTDRNQKYKLSASGIKVLKLLNK